MANTTGNLLRKHKALSSNPNTIQKKKRKIESICIINENIKGKENFTQVVALENTILS
jgi:hypothetical protein